MPRRSYEEVLAIKEALYNREPQASIAKRYSMAQPSVHAIKVGRAHNFVPWPDGTIGALGSLPEVTKSLDTGLLPKRTYNPAVQMSTVESLIEENDILASIEDPDTAYLDKARELQDVENNDILSAINNVGISPDVKPTKPKKITIADVNKLSWDEAIKIAGHLPAMAAADDDETIRDYVCAILHSLPEDQWRTMPIMDMALELKKEIG